MVVTVQRGGVHHRAKFCCNQTEFLGNISIFVMLLMNVFLLWSQQQFPTLVQLLAAERLWNSTLFFMEPWSLSLKIKILTLDKVLIPSVFSRCCGWIFKMKFCEWRMPWYTERRRGRIFTLCWHYGEGIPAQCVHDAPPGHWLKLGCTLGI